jgi:hypothetical protein
LFRLGLAEGETRWAPLMSKSAKADFDWRSEHSHALGFKTQPVGLADLAHWAYFNRWMN